MFTQTIVTGRSSNPCAGSFTCLLGPVGEADAGGQGVGARGARRRTPGSMTGLARRTGRGADAFPGRSGPGGEVTRNFFLFGTHHQFVARLLASLRRRLTFTTACKDSFITPGFPRGPIC